MINNQFNGELNFDEKKFWNDFKLELEQNEQESFNELYKALDYLKGHEVMIDSWNGIMVFKPFDNFNYSLKENRYKEMLLDFDNEDEEFTSGLTIKLKDIQDIEIDDNSEFIKNGEMTKYEVDNIIITLWNDSQLRLELQW